MGWLRKPRTTQEKRASQDGFARAKRTLKTLIDAWDDNAAGTQRSWKKHRKRQRRRSG